MIVIISALIIGARKGTGQFFSTMQRLTATFLALAIVLWCNNVANGYKPGRFFAGALHRIAPNPNILMAKKYGVGKTTAEIRESPIMPVPVSVVMEERADANLDFTKGMPDRKQFSSFYASTVAPGLEIDLERLIKYSVIADLLAKKVVFIEDVNDLWLSAVGDAQGLNEQESYDMLCMITDLPEPEDAVFFDAEFKKLAGGKATLPFFKFLNWDDVQDMINEEALSMEEISQCWRDVAGDLNTPIDRKTFGILNNALDDAIDTKEESLAADAGGNDSGDEVDLTDINVWDPEFDPMDVFEPEMLEEISTFFVKSSPKGKLTFENFMKWEDLSEMFSEGLTMAALQGVWNEASKGATAINLDTFIRLNIRLDLLLDELDSSVGSGTSVESAPAGGSKSSLDNEAEKYYRSEFKKITNGGRLLRLDMLLEWKEVTEMVADGDITEKQIAKIFEGLPKEPMGIPSTTFGITEDTFVAFNGMLDVILDATSTSAAPTRAATPPILISEPARPMPKMAEMKMGSLSDNSSIDKKAGIPGIPDLSDDATTGLSESELELMQVLDKADNMLNSGSFGDFDQLIGDVNDPRLQALREERDGADEVRGQLNDIIKELLVLGRKQSRCGLDRPEEEEAARIRDLIQAVIEKSPRAASRDITEIRKSITGKWKLLYTNSEMFSFYNGVTGFANVFPTAKFQDLATKYTSDGYLSEAQYMENLATPLGAINANVYATWEVMKEMSFMTNENSVVLRTYCTKVTAGPMEYEAQENWKSLRTLSMNELVYVDDRIKIMRNSGALRIFFVYEKELQ